MCIRDRYYDAVTVGIDFTARDLQRQFREEGKPWELCKGFDSSSRVKVVLVSEIVFAISKSYTLFEIRCQYPSLILSSDSKRY